MGIRFYCPNDHKLNVKAFQAGRRGICPYCGASMMIPTESTIPSRQPGSTPVEKQSSTAVEKQRSPSTPVPATWAAAPTPLASQELAGQAAPIARQSPGVIAMTAPKAAPSPDPLTEAPTAVWYVRPAAGGQYGPATSDIMRGWLTEGRIGADSLVWREGWPDWQEAGQVFPQLKPNDMMPLMSGSAAPSLPHIPAPAPAAGRSVPPTGLIIGALAVTVVVLVVVLLVILFSQPAAAPAPGPQPTPAASAAIVVPPSPPNPKWT